MFHIRENINKVKPGLTIIEMQLNHEQESVLKYLKHAKTPKSLMDYKNAPDVEGA